MCSIADHTSGCLGDTRRGADVSGTGYSLSRGALDGSGDVSGVFTTTGAESAAAVRAIRDDMRVRRPRRDVRGVVRGLHRLRGYFGGHDRAVARRVARFASEPVTR